MARHTFFCIDAHTCGNPVRVVAGGGPLLPNVPTLKELGYNIDISLWYGVFVRSETPQPIVKRLTEELSVVMKSPKIKTRWDTLGLEVGDKFGDDFATYYRSEYKRWGEVLIPLGIKAEQ